MSPLRIGELAEAAGVRRDTIRYYERTGLLPTPERTSAGYRVYQQSDADRIRFIRSAQGLGFTLAETQTLLQLQASDAARASDILAVTLDKLQEAETKVAKLNRIREILEPLAEACPREAPTDECPILAFISTGDLSQVGAVDPEKNAGEDETTLKKGRN